MLISVSIYYVYIIECKDKTLYTGITTDIARRLKEHKEGRGAHYTRVHGVKKLLYSEKAKNRSLASKREMSIKKVSREKKLALIRSSRR